MTFSSGSQVHYMKADLPPELLEDSRWHRIIMPTLLLWAGECEGVWGVGRPVIAYMLPLIIDFCPSADLDLSTMDISIQGAIVSVVHDLVHLRLVTNTFHLSQAYQWVYDWQHNVASTAITIVISLLQCTSSDHEVKDMADILLESCSCLYTDVEACSPDKAFHSNLMLQLLNAIHLQYVNGSLQSLFAISPPLHTYSGIIALCAAAVCPINQGNVCLILGLYSSLSTRLAWHQTGL